MKKNKKRPIMNYDQVSEEIKTQYKNSPTRQKLAEKCLEKAKEWLERFYDENDVGNLTASDYKRMRRECAAYVKKNVDATDERNVYGSVLLVIVMGAVISWLVQRLLDNMFDE